MRKRVLVATTLFVAGIMSFVSCCNHNEDIQTTVPSIDRKAVQFSSNIVKMAPATRAAGNTWDSNDFIGVYMLEKESTDVVEGMANVHYITTAGGEAGKFVANDEIIYFPDNGTEVRFMAYYPYTASVADYIYKVTVDDQSVQQAIDLLYSFNIEKSYEKTTSETVIPMAFDHQLTKIFVHVKAGAGLSSSDLEDINVYFSGLNTTADFYLKNGTLANFGNVANINLRSIAAKGGDYVASFESIILPMETILTDSKIVFTLASGSEFVWNFDTVLNPSTKYIYNVTISRSGIEVEATINDWIDGGESTVDAE